MYGSFFRLVQSLFEPRMTDNLPFEILQNFWSLLLGFFVVSHHRLQKFSSPKLADI